MPDDTPGVGEVLDAHLAALAAHEVLYARLLCEATTLAAGRARAAVRAAIRYRLAAARPRYARDVARGAARAMDPVALANTWIALTNHYLMNRDLFAPGAERDRGARRRAQGAVARDPPPLKDPRHVRQRHSARPAAPADFRCARPTISPAAKSDAAYCSTCGDETGQLKPYDDVLRANADYLVRQQGARPGRRARIGPRAARQHAGVEEPRLIAGSNPTERNPPCKSSSVIAPLFVFAGLVGGAARAAPVPPPELAEAQLRAINHRFVESFVVAHGEFMDALTAEDFLQTASDGSWHGRADFVAQMRKPAPLDGATYDDVRVRLFGPVALLHGVFEALHRRRQGGEGPLHRRVRLERRRLAAGERPEHAASGTRPLRQQTATAPAHAPWHGQDPAGDDLAVLRTLNENYVKAFREADVAWYDAHLAPDYVVVSGDGSFHDRAAALDQLRQAVVRHAHEVVSGRQGQHPSLRRRRVDPRRECLRAQGRAQRREPLHRHLAQTEWPWLCIAAHITVHKAPAP